MPVTIRAEVAEAVRKAAGLIYTQAPRGMTYDWLAAQLDNEAVDSEVIARWAEEDCWEQRRAKITGERMAAASVELPAPTDAAKRAEDCLKAVKSLHNDAVLARRKLRPKSWEQAAMVQLRCAEALRHWSLEEERQDDNKRDDNKRDAAAGGPPVINADKVLTEEQWQDMAHVLLAKKKPS